LLCAGGTVCWIVAAYLLLTIGELLVMPMTQALLVELAPANRVGLASGLWFAALASGHGLAGLLGASWTILPHEYFFMALAILVSTAGFVVRRYFGRQRDIGDGD
jgi:proton-dependent oligopeptide transporter, POT family